MFFFHFFHFELPLMSANDDDPPDSSWLENVSDESKDRSVIRSDWSDIRMDLDDVDVEGENERGANPSSEKYGWSKASLAVMRPLDENDNIRWKWHEAFDSIVMPYDCFYLSKNRCNKICSVASVTRKKSPNVYKSCPKMISLEKG